jgi:type II secretory pathway pseudopilin PulG
MIELIFVIAIIGILASVAIPKVAANVDNADAGVCELEVTQLARELGNAYSMFGHGVFLEKKVSTISNIRIIGTSNETRGILTDENMVTGVQYVCDGVKIVNYIYSYDTTIFQYGLTLEVIEGTTPASRMASEMLKKNLSIEANGKYYIF